MKLIMRSFYYILLSVTIPSNVMTLQKEYEGQSLRSRVKRQEGYVYDKPNISFDLPSQSTTESTQGPTVDRTLVQKIMYNYPAPAGREKIDISSTGGSSAGTAKSGPSNGPSSSYNYQISGSSNAGTGYNYGSSGSSAVQTNTRSLNANPDSQSTGNFQPTTNTGSSDTNSGYGNNLPSPTLSPSLQGLSVSTSAPKYLPPTAGDGKENFGGGSTAVSSMRNSGQFASSIGVPFNNYLPPFGNNAVSVGKTTSSTQIGNQANLPSAVSVPNTAYLPPLSASPDPTQSQLQVPTTTAQSATPSGIYIPSSNIVSNSGSVSTPSSGYLPPRFF